MEANEELVGPTTVMKKFQDPRWMNGTWDLKPFQKDGKTDWDAGNYSYLGSFLKIIFRFSLLGCQIEDCIHVKLLIGSLLALVAVGVVLAESSACR